MPFHRFVAGLALVLLGACEAAAPPAPVAQAPSQSRQALRRHGDTSLFNFETGPQGWGTSPQGCPHCSTEWVGNNGGQAEVGPTFAGDGALKFHIDNTPNQGWNQVQVTTPDGVSQGDTLTFAIWMPANVRASIIGVQPYVKDPSGDFSGTYMSEFFEPQDAWMQFSIVNPFDTVQEMGVLFTLKVAYSGNVYIDSVSVQH